MTGGDPHILPILSLLLLLCEERAFLAGVQSRHQIWALALQDWMAGR